MRDELVQILGEAVVIVAGSGLAGFSKPATVISDYTVSGSEQRGNLLLPGGAVQRVSMDENHWISAAVILVIQFDVGRILFSDIDVRHGKLLS